MDDLLIHLALVPGGLSLLGYLVGNPTYLSIHADARVGISLLEMGFLGPYAVAAVVSNPRLFLWKFLTDRRSNQLVFGLLFLNQFVVPLIVGVFLSRPGAQGFATGTVRARPPASRQRARAYGPSDPRGGQLRSW